MRSRVVGIGDCVVSADPEDLLVTHGLGSCIAVLIHDPVARIAGLLHYMLPNSAIDPERAEVQPFLYANTGIPLLFHRAYECGAQKARLAVIGVGGAQMMYPEGTFDIGKQNQQAMRKILSRAGVPIRIEDTGGFLSRTVRIEVATGKVLLRIPGASEQEMNPRGWMRRTSPGP